MLFFLTDCRFGTLLHPAKLAKMGLYRYQASFYCITAIVPLLMMIGIDHFNIKNVRKIEEYCGKTTKYSIHGLLNICKKLLALDIQTPQGTASLMSIIEKLNKVDLTDIF